MADGVRPTVTDRTSVVITGASRGLGLASAAHLYHRGWTVVAAMRSPEVGLDRLRELTAASAGDQRLIGVRLDLDDAASISEAGRAILEAVGAPDALVHNAGIAGVGCVEEMPADVYRQIFSTNFFGPVLLTKELLPAMRAAGRGRIVVVSSQGGVHGMPGISAYSAAKGALERWAESLAQEVSPFGLRVTVLLAGSFKTDILELTQSHADEDGPYAELHAALLRTGERIGRIAAPPTRFARGLDRALDDPAPFARHAVGLDAHAMALASRLLPARLFQAMVGRALGLPGPGRLRGTAAQRRTVAPSRVEEASDG
jgi:NAD(P)-dependent dehydrogenase (short-subunit alcohol dehydrogenase family)